MRISLTLLTTFLFLFLGCPRAIHAQLAESSIDRGTSPDTNASPAIQNTDPDDSPYRLKSGDNEIGFWVGGAFSASTIFEGLSKDEARGRRFVIAAFRYGRTLAANRSLALQYTLDAIPLAVATGNIVEATTVVTPTGSTTTYRRESAYGIGVSSWILRTAHASSRSFTLTEVCWSLTRLSPSRMRESSLLSVRQGRVCASSLRRDAR